MPSRRPCGARPARDRPGCSADAVAERLRARNVDPESVEWDAWRREDGRWTLVADYLSGGSARHAEFVFDAPGRFVVAEDDEARWMVGEQTAVKGPQPRATPGTPAAHAVDAGDVLPLGEDAIEMVSRGQRPGPRRTADWMATQASARPVGTRSRSRSSWAARPTSPAEDEEADPAARKPPKKRAGARRCRAGTRSCLAGSVESEPANGSA